MEIARETGGYPADAACDWVEVHVWPVEGPHWTETPRFAKALIPPDEDDDDAEEPDRG